MGTTNTTNTNNTDYFKMFEEIIGTHSINPEEIEEDYKVECELEKYDIFVKDYKRFFVDGVLKTLIEGYLRSINNGNVKSARESKKFEFVIVKEKRGKNVSLGGFNNFRYETQIHYETIYGNGFSGTFGYEDLRYNYSVDYLIRYLFDVLNAKIYEMEEVEFSEWVTVNPKKVTNDGPWGRPVSSYEREKIGISFKCSFKQLINMYYLECLRYLNICDAKEYNDFLGKK